MQNVPEGRPRPHGHYRQVFYDRLIAQSPGSVLDVGCGSGALLARLSEDGIAVAGLEADPELAASAPPHLQVTHGVAEALPFDDGSFDWVLCEFTAHHFENLALALSESARVARRGVAILDQWYDPFIPSQITAERFDRWCKQVDRSTGMIHNPSLTTAACLTRLQSLPKPTRVEVGTLFTPVEIEPNEVEAIAETVLAKAPSGDPFAAELDAIIKEAFRTGFTDDGAILAFGHFE